MKLLFQSDDYGITEGVTCGILKGIRDGLICNTGLFTNMPSSEFAAEQIKQYPDVCLGVDINLVAGRALTQPDQIPAIVKPTGEFFSSGEVRARSKFVSMEMGVIEIFEEDPFPLDELLIETEAQVKKYIELVGKKPGYIHPHSLVTPNTNKAFSMIGEKYGIPYTFDLYQKLEVHWITNDWNVKPFTVEKQIQTDVEANYLKVFPEMFEHEISLLICHAGFVDEDIFRCSTYTIIRNKDLYMACSPRIREFIDSNKIELVTYRDIV